MRPLSALAFCCCGGERITGLWPLLGALHNALAGTQTPQLKGRAGAGACFWPLPLLHLPARATLYDFQTTYLTVIYSPTSLEPLLFMYLFGGYFSLALL